jgi:hypothetical protein
MWVPDTVYILHSLVAGTTVASFHLALTCHLLKISRVIVDYGISSNPTFQIILNPDPAPDSDQVPYLTHNQAKLRFSRA